MTRALVRFRIVALAAVVLTGAGGASRADDAAPTKGDVASTVTRPWIDADPPGRSLEDRLEEIRRRIEGELVYPAGARWRDLEGAAVVEFAIASDGTAREIRLARSSGEPSLDRAAERAVESAHDLPYVWGRLEVPVRFTLAGSR